MQERVFAGEHPHGITGSPALMNKAITEGAGGSASDAGGGAGGGGGGGGGGGAGGPSGPSSPSGGGGSASSSSTTAAKGPSSSTAGEDKYCPEKGKMGPPPYEGRMNAADLRQVPQDQLAKASPAGQKAAHAACDLAAGTGPEQAFWSNPGPGGGREAAEKAGKKIQEKGEGGAALEQMVNDGEFPDEWNDEMGEGSGVTGMNAWRTLSMRSAENATGTVDAYTVGTAWPHNVFSDYELPRLLHNENQNPQLDHINFRDPSHPEKVVETWEKRSDGCWHGKPVPGDKNKKWPGFRLHPSKGIERPPP